MRKLAFTLMEVMIVTIVVAIIATIGFTTFIKTVASAEIRAARRHVDMMIAAQDVRNEIRASYETCATVSECELDLKIDLPDDGKWTYSCNAGALTCTATKVRNPYSGCQITKTFAGTVTINAACP
ncbi:MAG: type II secretion system protein [Candidatus Omnitrophica bacterium]|nr:type II secretion system protein [Candidatus Omnitrophota bacterium]